MTFERLRYETGLLIAGHWIDLLEHGHDSWHGNSSLGK